MCVYVRGTKKERELVSVCVSQCVCGCVSGSVSVCVLVGVCVCVVERGRGTRSRNGVEG